MLRLLVLSLVLLNGVYFSWGQGWLLPYGFGPATQREPQRLAQQVRPTALTLLRPDAETAAPAEPAATETAKPAALAQLCLQSPPLDATQAAALRSALQTSLPAQAWTMEALATPSRWLVYMGKYETAADVAKKRAQLAALGLKLYPLGNAALAPGLSLGSHASEAEAQAALAALNLRGVRSARVLEDAPTLAGYRLQLQGSADSLQALLTELNATQGSKPLIACPVSKPASP